MDTAKVLVSFLSDQKDWRATSPLPQPIFFQKSSNQNKDQNFIKI